MIFHPLAGLAIILVITIGVATLVLVPVAMLRSWYRDHYVHPKSSPYVTGSYTGSLKR